MGSLSFNIFESKLCVGCGLCESITGGKVVLSQADNGFLRPVVIDDVPENEMNLIHQSCPALVIHKDSGIRASQTDPFWGDFQRCYIGTSASDEIESSASSGGVVSTILIYLLDNKEIDAAVHIGPNPANPLENIVKVSTNTTEVLSNADSRYAPSAPMKTIIQVLQPGKKYAFVGKPCDVSALRTFSKLNGQVAEQVKYYLSFFCFGIPSLNQTKKLMAQLGVNENHQVDSLYYRKSGWPGAFKVHTVDNQTFSVDYKDYMHFLFSDLHLRCKICPDGLGESADITNGDAWNEFDESGYPSFKNARGSNIIISKTGTGDKLLTEIIRSRRIRIDREVFDLRSIDNMQPGQLGKKKYYSYRILAFKLARMKIPVIDSYIYRDISRVEKVGLKAKISQIYGTWKRIRALR